MVQNKQKSNVQKEKSVNWVLVRFYLFNFVGFIFILFFVISSISQLILSCYCLSLSLSIYLSAELFPRRSCLERYVCYSILFSMQLSLCIKSLNFSSYLIKKNYYYYNNVQSLHFLSSYLTTYCWDLELWIHVHFSPNFLKFLFLYLFLSIYFWQ